MMCFPFFCDISATLLQIVHQIAKIPGGAGLWGVQKCVNYGSLAHVRTLLSKLSTKFNLAYGDRISTVSTVFEDNRAAKILATTDPPRLTPCSKSLAVRYCWAPTNLPV